MSEYSTHAPMPAAAGRGVVQIHDGNVSPTRIHHIDEDGIPVEETICTLSKSAKFVDRSGNVCDVPLACSRTIDESSWGEKYERQIREDQIRGGALPLTECPYTFEYRKVLALMGNKTGQLAAPVKGDEELARQGGCGGSPEGCVHIQRIITSRREKAAKAHRAQEMKGATITLDAAKEMARGFGEGASKGPAQAKSARANLIAGNGE